MELFLQQVVNGLVIGSTYAVVALGFSLTFSVMRVVNMVHPEVFTIAMFVGLLIAGATQNSLVLVVVGTLAVAAVIGLGVERAVLRPLRSPNILIPLLGTIGASLVLMHSIAAFFGSDPLPFPQVVPMVVYSLGEVAVTSTKLVNFGTAAVVMLAVSYYVQKTKWGLATRAIAERPDVASAFGIDINRVAQYTVVLSSVLAALGGLSIAMLYGSAWAFVGGLYSLKSFVCMLVSGNRSIEGVMAVGLFLGVIEALVSGYLSSSYRDAVAFVLLIGVLYVRPNGVFGSHGH